MNFKICTKSVSELSKNEIHIMKTLKARNAILVIFVCGLMISCATLQQPLPGSLWGDWSFVRTGTLIDSGNDRLINYNNVCYKESDRLSFSSDNKLSLRWYDESCMIHYYYIGQYHVENNTLKIDLAESIPFQDSPFPPITQFRISQISYTTLKLEEIPNDDNRNGRNRGRTNIGYEPLVFIFMRID